MTGTPLYGYYEIDGDGVTPEAEMTLVEKGVFKRMLNGRFPTLKAPVSTGSARFHFLPAKPDRDDGNGNDSHPGGENRLPGENEKGIDQGCQGSWPTVCVHRERCSRLGPGGLPGGPQGREGDTSSFLWFPYARFDQVAENHGYILEGGGHELLA